MYETERRGATKTECSLFAASEVSQFLARQKWRRVSQQHI